MSKASARFTQRARCCGLTWGTALIQPHRVDSSWQKWQAEHPQPILQAVELPVFNFAPTPAYRRELARRSLATA